MLWRLRVVAILIKNSKLQPEAKENLSWGSELKMIHHKGNSSVHRFSRNFLGCKGIQLQVLQCRMLQQHSSSTCHCTPQITAVHKPTPLSDRTSCQTHLHCGGSCELSLTFQCLRASLAYCHGTHGGRRGSCEQTCAHEPGKGTSLHG